MTGRNPQTYRFGRFILDLRRGVLLRDGVERPLRPKPAVLLRLLIENGGNLVSRDDVAAAVWPGVIVSDDSIYQCVRAVRQALDDEAQETLRTVPKRGFLFIPQVTLNDVPAADTTLAEQNRAVASGLAHPSAMPSIAVLRFLNLSDDQGMGYFVDGFVEEIITALSSVPTLFVVASASSFGERHHAGEGSQAGRDLGVRYVLDGSVRREGDSLRVTARLMAAETGAHLWGERFNGVVSDLFALQDQVASNVAGIIEPTLRYAETARSVNRPTADLDAYDLYLRGHALFLASALQIGAALRLLEDAIAREPRYGAALGLAAMCCQRLVADSRSNDPVEDRLKACDYARRALEAAPHDCGVLVNAALAMAYFGSDIDAMLALVDRALALNPNFARGWHVSGHLRLRAGLLEEAIEHTERSRRLSPRARVGNGALVTIGASHFYARRFDRALPYLLQAVQEDPDNPNPYRYLAACYAFSGQSREAAATIAELRRVTDHLVPDVKYLKVESYKDLFLLGLDLAINTTRS